MEKLPQDVNIDRLNALVSALSMLVVTMAVHHPERKLVLQTLQREDGSAEFDGRGLLLPASAVSVQWAKGALERWMRID